ncbi:hypothetical protein Bca101_080780 [Brassica carinata]
MIKSKRLAYDGRGNAVANSQDGLSSAVKALGGFGRGLYVEKGHHLSRSWLLLWLEEKMVPWFVIQLLKLFTEGAGFFAVELFLTEDGQILLNEVAPRPHNSGHQTIEACYTSQFEQHLRALVGLPLGDPSMRTPASIMYNILGEDDGEAGFRMAHLIARALSVPGESVHWYDKPEMRKQRKMGHITLVGESMGVLEQRLQCILKTPRVGIIMGSDSDLPVMKDAAKILDMFGVTHEFSNIYLLSLFGLPKMPRGVPVATVVL